MTQPTSTPDMEWLDELYQFCGFRAEDSGRCYWCNETRGNFRHTGKAAITTKVQQMVQEAEKRASDPYELLSKLKPRPTLDRNTITIRGDVIQFGQHKPPYDYLKIHFDREKKRIMFTEGVPYDQISYKVCKNPRSGSYTIKSRAFASMGVLPDGIYRRTSSIAYDLTTNQGAKHDNPSV